MISDDDATEDNPLEDELDNLEQIVAPDTEQPAPGSPTIVGPRALSPLRTIDLVRRYFGHDVTVTTKQTLQAPTAVTAQVFGYDATRIAWRIQFFPTNVGNVQVGNTLVGWRGQPGNNNFGIPLGVEPLMYDWTVYGDLPTQALLWSTDSPGDAFYITQFFTNGYVDR